MGNVFKSINDIAVDGVKWVDARYSLQDENWGKKKFEEGHIKDAVHWDLGKDLSDLKLKSGRHPLPDKDELTSLFRESGLEFDDLILVYDDGGAPFATRAWWILQYAGFKNSFISLEGFDQLQALGVLISDEVTKPEPTKVVPEWNESIFASRQFVEKTVAGETNNVLVDARSAERYRGEVEPIDPIAGHIPGALNFDWEQLKKNGAYDLGSDVKDQLSKVVNQEDEITVYCGSGVTATPLFALLKHNGYNHVKLYVGSYSDWISRDSIEVEKG